MEFVGKWEPTACRKIKKMLKLYIMQTSNPVKKPEAKLLNNRRTSKIYPINDTTENIPTPNSNTSSKIANTTSKRKPTPKLFVTVSDRSVISSLYGDSPEIHHTFIVKEPTEEQRNKMVKICKQYKWRIEKEGKEGEKYIVRIPIEEYGYRTNSNKINQFTKIFKIGQVEKGPGNKKYKTSPPNKEELHHLHEAATEAAPKPVYSNLVDPNNPFGKGNKSTCKKKASPTKLNYKFNIKEMMTEKQLEKVKKLCKDNGWILKKEGTKYNINMELAVPAEKILKLQKNLQEE